MKPALTHDLREPLSLRGFYQDKSFVRAVMGPVGSAKTSCVICHDVLARAARQVRSPVDGVRYSKELIVRCNMPQLRTSTIPTWLNWVPPEVFKSEFTWGPPASHHIRFCPRPSDLTDIVDLTAIFWGIEGPADIDKLDGFEVSRVRINAASEADKRVFGRCVERTNRFPGEEHGFCSEPGVTMDYNPPNADHWLYEMMEVQHPQDTRFWKQPPAVFRDTEGMLISLDGTRYSVNRNGDEKRGIMPADNINHLSSDYYSRQVGVRTDSEIRVFLMNEYGFLQSGDPVHPLYDDVVHYANAELLVYPEIPVCLGFDFGNRPAVAIFQHSPTGQLRVVDELCSDNFTTLDRFLDERLIPHLNNHYPGAQAAVGGKFWRALGWGDPSGRAGEGHEQTAFDECQRRGLYVVSAPGYRNTLAPRIKALDDFLGGMIKGGKPAFLLSNKCPMIRAGLAGRYRFANVKSGGNTGEPRKEPEKSPFSHPCEGLEYGALGLTGIGSKQDLALAAAIEKYNKSLSPMQNSVGY